MVGTWADFVRYITLFKYQTVGNSYLVFDPERNGLTERRAQIARDWIRKVCDANLGAGSNGVLVGPDYIGASSFDFRIFNSDASQAQLSGNGSRIFARYLLDAGYVNLNGPKFTVVAVSDRLERVVVDVSVEGADPLIKTCIVHAPSFGPHAVGATSAAGAANSIRVSVPALELLGRSVGIAEDAWSDSTMVSIGNPHCVTFVRSREELPSLDLLAGLHRELSSIACVRNDASEEAVFEGGCNLQWCFVEDRRRLHLRIFERGEGLTLSSGSSAAAAAVAAFARQLVERQVSVVMPGGRLDLALHTQGNNIMAVELAGRVHFIAKIQLADVEVV